MNITFRQIPSANYMVGREGTAIDRIIIHWCDGNLASADQRFHDPTQQAFATYGIEDNTIYQWVKESDTSYNAGDWQVNLRSISIEHSAQPGRDASPATIQNSIQLVADICKRNNIPCDRQHILKHSEVYATACPGTIPIDDIVSEAAKIVGGSMKPNRGDIINICADRGYTPSEAEIAKWMAMDWPTAYYDIKNNIPAKIYANSGDVINMSRARGHEPTQDEINHWQGMYWYDFMRELIQKYPFDNSSQPTVLQSGVYKVP